MQRGAILVALLTPFTSTGEIDTEALSNHVSNLRTAGVDGFFVCGTTGEGPLLDDDEVVTVTRAVLASCGNAGSVMTQVGRASTKATLRLLDKVLEAGVQEVTAVTPYYYELDSHQMEEHYRELINAAGGSPLYAYVIPRRTGNDIMPQLARRLAGIGLAGMKDSTRSMERHLEYLQIAADPAFETFKVYMGTDALAAEGFQRGSTGIVSAIANLDPELFISLRTAVLEGQEGVTREYQSKIDRVRQSLGSHNTIGELKSGVNLRLKDHGLEYPEALRSPLTAAIP